MSCSIYRWLIHYLYCVYAFINETVFFLVFLFPVMAFSCPSKVPLRSVSSASTSNTSLPALQPQLGLAALCRREQGGQRLDGELMGAEMEQWAAWSCISVGPAWCVPMPSKMNPNSVFVRTLTPLHWGQCIFSGTRNSWRSASVKSWQ